MGVVPSALKTRIAVAESENGLTDVVLIEFAETAPPTPTPPVTTNAPVPVVVLAVEDEMETMPPMFAVPAKKRFLHEKPLIPKS
jgi:hypothetical protein